jgi:tetratricopeptide (TPR) repeat protein
VAHAVQLEGESGDALRALALAAWQFEFDWEEADALYRRALGLDPTSALTHHWYGVLLGVTRRFDQEIAHFAQAEALDPLSLVSLATRGWFTLFAGRPEEAHAILRRVFTLDSSYFPAYWFDAQALAVLGRHEEAIRSLTRATELAGRTSRMLGYLGYVTGLAGRKEEALGLLAQLRQRAADDYVPPYSRRSCLRESPSAPGRWPSSGGPWTPATPWPATSRSTLPGGASGRSRPTRCCCAS